MKTTIQQQVYPNRYAHEPHSFSLTAAWNKLMAYAESQEPRRYWWMALSILGHGTIFTIATMASVILLGNNFALLTVTCCNMVMAVVVNLAEVYTKYIVPVFFF